MSVKGELSIPRLATPSSTNVCDTFYSVLQDANYNVMALVDSDGAMVERYEYTPYGQRTVYKRASTSQTMPMSPILDSQRVIADSTTQPYGLCEFGHQGLYHDEEIGIIYNRARYVHPLLGNFLNRDPQGYVDGMNLYLNRRGNPVNGRDPMGLYDPRVHKSLTCLLALAAGFSEQDCDMISDSDEDVDDRMVYLMPGISLGVVDSSQIARFIGWWWQKEYWDIWHLPGAYMDAGSGVVNRQGEGTQRMLKILHDAAFVGHGEDRFEYYGHSGLEGKSSRTDTFDEGTYSITTSNSRETAVIPPPVQTSYTGYEGGCCFDAPGGYQTTVIWHRVTSITVEAGDDRTSRLRMLGVFLHSSQDSFSHHGGQIGHKEFFRGDYDLTDWDPTVALDMAKDTLTTLTEFGTRHGAVPRSDFAQLKPLISEFVRAKGPAGRSWIYRQVREALSLSNPPLRTWSTMDIMGDGQAELVTKEVPSPLPSY